MMKFVNYVKSTWITLLCVAVGIFLVVGYFTIWQDKAERCTMPVTAVITDYEESLISEENETRYEYRLTIEYEVDGETYYYAETTKSQPDIGDTYELMYDPADPSVAMTPGGAKLMWVAPVIGAALIVFFGWLSIPRSKRKSG